jgi:hypothetical protein
MQQLILLATMVCLTVPALSQKTSFDSLSYFPSEIYSEVGDRIDSLSFIERSRMLSKFNEPKLISAQRANVVFRFTWTRSFHEIMIVRMILYGDSATLVTKTEIKQSNSQEEKKNRFDVNNKVAYRVDSLSVGQETVANFLTLVNRNKFWEMKNVSSISAMHDGAGWLLEANDQKKGYKMLYRRSPGDHEQHFRDICLFLIRLTRDSEKLEVY